MIITWHGHHTIKMVTQGSTIVLDPHSNSVNNTSFKGKANIVGLSNPEQPEMSHLSDIPGEPRVIDTPGEYALAEATVYARGWHNEQGQEQSIQRWKIEGMTILHLGHLNRPLQEEELQELEQINIDILLLPVGDKNGLSTSEAVELVTTIEPSILIPINFKTKKSKNDLATVDQFAKEMGTDPKKVESKLNIAAKKIDRENLSIVILSA